MFREVITNHIFSNEQTSFSGIIKPAFVGGSTHLSWLANRGYFMALLSKQENDRFLEASKVNTTQQPNSIRAL